MEKKGSSGTIQHEGTVHKINVDSVDIRISPESACSGCHAEGFCNLTGREDKILNVSGKFNVSAGDKVNVVIASSMGVRAVLLGYLIPLIILIAVLVTLTALSVRELIAGLISIGILGPYFLILQLFRKRIDQSFSFTLKT